MCYSPANNASVLERDRLADQGFALAGRPVEIQFALELVERGRTAAEALCPRKPVPVERRPPRTLERP